MSVVRWLHRRLWWDAHSADERVAMARAAIYLLGLSGLLGLAAAATMTAISGRLPAGALVPALGCTLVGAVLLARFERLSREAVDLALACGTVLSATSLALAGDGGTGMETYFLWAVLFAAFFPASASQPEATALAGAHAESDSADPGQMLPRTISGRTT
jgi:hypothetical protein